MRKEIYRSGPFVADATLRTLSRQGETLTVTPKVFDALVFFLRNSNRVVSREELAAGLWQSQLVSEANLNQHVSMLRKALGGGECNRCLVTLPGRGYQWVLPVVEEPVVEGKDTAADVLPKRWKWPGRWLWLVLAGFVCVGVVGFWLRGSGTAGASLSGPRRPFTRLAGSEYQPAISRDGSKVAFLWDQEGRAGPSVFAKGVEDDESRKVSGGTAEESSPAWSPDGRQLAYLRFERSALKLVVQPERGGEERVLASLFPTRYGLTCRHLDWSPDGLTIVVDDKTSPQEPFGLFLVDAGTGARKRLTQPTDPIIGDVDPRFSPDGSKISFVRLTDRFRHALLTVSASGGAAKVWTDDSKSIAGQDWSPDGKRIFFSSIYGREFEIRSLDRPGGKPMAAGIASSFPIQFSVARAGGRLVYSEFLPDLNIWRLDLHGAHGGADPWSRIISSTGEDSLPQLSPDGSRLCFRSDRSGDAQLWISDAGGAGAVQLTRGPLHPVAGRWSPDGRQLAFNDAVSLKLYVVDAAGGSPRMLGGKEVAGNHPMFSFDGRAILFNRSSNGFHGGGILELQPGNGKVTSVLASLPVHQKIFSRDGRFLYFTGGRTDGTIWRYELSNGQVVKVLDTLLPGYWGAWAVSARGVYYMAEDDNPTGGSVIRFHSFLENSDSPVARLPGPLPPIGTAMWTLTPDDRYLYCVRVDLSQSDLTMVEGVR